MKTDNISLTYGPDGYPGQWWMSISPNQYGDGPGNYKKLKAKVGEADTYKFKIKTEKINFTKDKPIEISLAPGQTGPGDPGQFTWTGEGTDTLTVTNPNKDSGSTDYYYKLNFDNGTSLDPIIQNGCCRMAPAPGTGMSFLSDPGAIAIAAGAILIAVLIVMRLRRARG